jgi:hypothetical protein
MNTSIKKSIFNNTIFQENCRKIFTIYENLTNAVNSSYQEVNTLNENKLKVSKEQLVNMKEITEKSFVSIPNQVANIGLTGDFLEIFRRLMTISGLDDEYCCLLLDSEVHMADFVLKLRKAVDVDIINSWKNKMNISRATQLVFVERGLHEIPGSQANQHRSDTVNYRMEIQDLINQLETLESNLEIDCFFEAYLDSFIFDLNRHYMTYVYMKSFIYTLMKADGYALK